MVVPGVLPEGVSVLVGPWGCGKTVLALQIAISVSGGGPLFGKIAIPEPRPVLYCSVQHTPAGIKERLLPFRDILDKTDLVFTFAIHPVGLAAVLPWVREHPNGLVIVDSLTWAGLRPRDLVAFARAHGVPMLGVRHVRGTGGRLTADAVLSLRPVYDNLAGLRVRVRGRSPRHYALRFDPERGWLLVR